MAYALRHKNICFIHMPKTSGTWVKRVLSEVEHGNRDGSLTHDLPHRWDYEMVFTVVREPAEWLASVWAHRIRENWQDYPQRIPWQYLLQVTDPYKANKFHLWIDNITTHLPGVVGWFYSFYTPPLVTVVRKEFDLYEFLRELGGDPWKHVPVNTGFNTPEVTDEIREKVKVAEADTYKKYGY